MQRTITLNTHFIWRPTEADFRNGIMASQAPTEPPWLHVFHICEKFKLPMAFHSEVVAHLSQHYAAL